MSEIENKKYRMRNLQREEFYEKFPEYKDICFYIG